MDKKILLGRLEQFKSAHILVVGDIILDRFIWGKVSRISPEAPVPVVDINHESIMLGGAANVLNNIISLGGKASICGAVGDDEMGRRIIHELRLKNINTDGIIVDSCRPTTVKTRVIAHNQQVVRFDRESKGDIACASEDIILGYLKAHYHSFSGIIISDYAKGVVTKKLVSGIVRMANGRKTPVAVDPKVGHFDYYKNVSVVTPNNLEASQAAGFEITDDASLAAAGKKLIERLKSDAVLITRGEYGMSLFQNGGKPAHIPTVAKEVYDVTGAGDTVIAVLMLALSTGADMREAAVIANHAAGIVVGEVGTATVGLDNLKKTIRQSTI